MKTKKILAYTQTTYTVYWNNKVQPIGYFQSLESAKEAIDKQKHMAINGWHILDSYGTKYPY